MKFFEVTEIEAAWSSARAQHVADGVGPATASYRQTLASRYSNGSVAVEAFDLAMPSDLVALVDHNENWKHSKLLECFWGLAGVRDHLPDLGAVDPQARGGFWAGDSFELCGFLASALFHGGAYSGPVQTAAASLTMARDAVAEIIGTTAPVVLFSNIPWCEYFFDVAWDRTAIVIAPGCRRVHVLLATDTD